MDCAKQKAKFIDDRIIEAALLQATSDSVTKSLRKLRDSEHSARFGSRALFTFIEPTDPLPRHGCWREQQRKMRRAMARNKTFHDNGCVLDTMEKGVHFPVLHVNWCPETNSVPASSIPPPMSGTRRKPTKRQHIKLMKSNDLGKEAVVQQGVYEEVKRIEPEFTFSGRSNTGNKAYIILGFKSLDTNFSSSLERSWRDWTGARSIYLNLHNEFDLARIIFYHRVAPRNQIDIFMYLVVVECWNVNSQNLIRILDFVQRMRVERLNGYISLYREVSLDESDLSYESSGSQESFDFADSDSTFTSSIKPKASIVIDPPTETPQGTPRTIIESPQTSHRNSAGSPRISHRNATGSPQTSQRNTTESPLTPQANPTNKPAPVPNSELNKVKLPAIENRS